MAPLKGEGDIPSSPGCLLLTNEESIVEPSVHNLRDVDPSGIAKPVSLACECKICERSPTLLIPQTSAQGVVGCHRVERDHW